MPMEPSARTDSPLDVGELRAEYDFDYTKARPNRFHAAHRAPVTTATASMAVSVALEPDVARAFPTAESVNHALRLLLQIARQSVPATGGAVRGGGGS